MRTKTCRPRHQKRAIARAILKHPELTRQERRLAMYLLRFADEHGVIKDPSINAMIAEVDDAVRDGRLDGCN
ncbi:hypothetical protein [Zhihengliuella halotolerans]|uniref:hypothetical protein n=1 Tax=Zhihengliuella halotolerans TaxID=370736 RepID=UPI0011AF03E6|nr:hypothetical protein [Zhihengliuella halotolerans]